MYKPLQSPEELEKDIKQPCKYCYDQDALFTVGWPMNKLSVAKAGKGETIYTYAAHCKGCSGLLIVALQGTYPELEKDFDGVSFG